MTGKMCTWHSRIEKTSDGVSCALAGRCADEFELSRHIRFNERPHSKTSEWALAWAMVGASPLLGPPHNTLLKRSLKKGAVAALDGRLQLTLHVPCKPHATHIQARCLTPVRVASCFLPSLQAPDVVRQYSGINFARNHQQSRAALPIIERNILATPAKCIASGASIELENA